MLFSSLSLPSLLSPQNIIWYLPSKKGSTVVVGISDEIVLYPFSKEDEAMAPSAEAWKQNMCVAAASVFCFFLPPEKMALVWHVAKIWKSQYCCLVVLLRATTVVLAPAITGPSKGDTCVIFMILFAYRKSYTFLAKAVGGSQHPRKDSTLPRITTEGGESKDNQIILPM